MELCSFMPTTPDKRKCSVLLKPPGPSSGMLSIVTWFVVLHSLTDRHRQACSVLQRFALLCTDDGIFIIHVEGLGNPAQGIFQNACSRTVARWSSCSGCRSVSAIFDITIVIISWCYKSWIGDCNLDKQKVTSRVPCALSHWSPYSLGCDGLWRSPVNNPAVAFSGILLESQAEDIELSEKAMSKAEKEVGYGGWSL